MKYFHKLKILCQIIEKHSGEIYYHQQGLLKSSKIVTAGPRFAANDYSSARYIYETCYLVPRLDKLSEERLNKLGLTHYGRNSNKKYEKRYLYLYNDDDRANLEGHGPVLSYLIL